MTQAQTIDADAAKKISKAKAALIMENPFFATIVCTLPISEQRGMNPPTFATNGKWIKYDPDFVNGMTFDETKFVLCHEVGHVVFQHMHRRGGRDPNGWNMAGDYIINNLLIQEKIGVMPKCGLHNPALVAAGGNTTEGVYNLLPPSDKDGSGGQGSGAGSPLDSCQDAGGTAAEVAEAAADLQVLVAQAAAAAKMCGNLSANLAQFVEAALKPKVNWKDVLRRFVSQRAKTEYTYARPKRRFAGDPDLYLPSLSGEAMGLIAVFEDYSGSISETEKAQFNGEVKAIVEDMQPSEIAVGYFTSSIMRVDRFQRGEEPEFGANYTGGTAFSPIFREVDGWPEQPVCLVVLTDLCCSDFGPPPPYPVLWITTERGSAPFGEVVEMNAHL